MKKAYYIIMMLLVLGLVGCAEKAKDSAANNTQEENENATVEKQEDKQDDTEVTPSATPTPSPTPEAAEEESKPGEEGEALVVDFDSSEIAKNIIGQSSTRKIAIYLPPSYKVSDKKYPVVYFLHGYGDSAQVFMRTYKPRLDKAFLDGAKEFIVVALDGNTVSGGSFYVNSPVSGNWEDYIVKELVTYMDENYRTIPDSNSRGISGYSMGGFGALNLALRHPDVFNSVIVFGPGLFAEEDLEMVLRSWNSDMGVKRSYAQAFSPNTEDDKNYGNVLNLEDLGTDSDVIKDWLSGFSNWGVKIDEYLALKQPLKAIQINYSKSDFYLWIPKGCINLANLLDEKNVSYTIDQYAGGHVIPGNAVDKYFAPFFNTNLNYE